MLHLTDVLKGTGGALAGMAGPDSPADPEFKRVVIDSREAQPGSLFVALKGERQDAHEFIADAVKRGARGVVLAEDKLTEAAGGDGALLVAVKDPLEALQRLAAYWRSKHEVEVIGVTGSIGKTTTKELVASVLAQRYKVLKSKQNLNNEIGLPLTLLELNEQYQKAVLEMGGAYAFGEISLLARLAQPRIGVVTNVSHVHLERMGTLEKIAETKSELVQALPSDGMAILNGDDPLVRAMAQVAQCPVWFFGLDPSCDLWADEIESRGLEGLVFTLHHQKEELHISIPLLGEHSVQTALAAAAVGLAEGETWEEIVAGLQNSAAQLRLVVAPGKGGSTIIDDTYNASPASTLAALNLLSDLEGRKVAVLGDMRELGDYEKEGHWKVGRRVAGVVDHLVVVGDLGRLIGEEAIRSGLAEQRVFFARSNHEAVDHLTKALSSGDYVLVKGSRALRLDEVVKQIREDVC